ncbi:DNA-binding protein [Streptomyces bikiniensis]|uniref:DNA-binding protein n=1 Tax=Streptomyces bikiniensis TaxID=1896 RepID=A0ABW8CQ56_STRBI
MEPQPFDTTRPRRRPPVEPILMETSEVAVMPSMSTSRVHREASKPGLKGYKLGRGKSAKVLHKRTEEVY